MRVAQLVPIFLVAVAFGIVVAHSFVRADTALVTITDGQWFVIANTFPTNATYVHLIAGQWGQMFNITTAYNVNSTQLQFTVFQNYQQTNQTTIEQLNSTIVGSGTFTIYLGLGSSSISSPEYTDIKWTCR